jgi:hypothetical protein
MPDLPAIDSATPTCPAGQVLASAPCSAPLVCASLQVLWWGVSIGGKHFTGDIVLHGPFRKVEMIRKLGRAEAKELSEREGRLWLSRQTETNKFDTLKQLERHAAKWCAANLGLSWVLFDGDRRNPSRVVASHGWIKDRAPAMNKLARMWGKVPNSKRDFKHPTVKKIYELWEAQFKEPNAKAQATPTEK